MRPQIKIVKGLDILIEGKPEQVIHAGQSVKTVALLGADYSGLKPRILVEAGQAVGLGEPLFIDKRFPEIQYTAPGSGWIKAVNRGFHRALQSVEIELDDDAAPEKTFATGDANDQAAIRKLLWLSGIWSSFRTRPYNQVPAPAGKPCAIFITAIDTRPLAPNPDIVVAEHQDKFSKGMHVISQLTEEPVFLCTAPDWTGPEPTHKNIVRVEFSGPHPAGLPGTHIHHLNPVFAGSAVWHINFQDVISIGHLFETGRLFTERVISLGGPGVINPRLLLTRPGANIEELLSNETHATEKCRLISGSVLDGFTAVGPTSYLGRYDNQVSVIVSEAMRRRFGWLSAGSALHGFTDSMRSMPERSQAFTTALNGRKVAMIPTEAFERVMPLDILPTPLLRALLIKDTDTAQSLGCLELAEEDLALCSFICPAKQDYGAALRVNLEQIAQEG